NGSKSKAERNDGGYGTGHFRKQGRNGVSGTRGVGVAGDAAGTQECDQPRDSPVRGSPVRDGTRLARRGDRVRSVAGARRAGLHRRVAVAPAVRAFPGANRGATVHGSARLPAAPVRRAILQLLALPVFGAVVREPQGRTLSGHRLVRRSLCALTLALVLGMRAVHASQLP